MTGLMVLDLLITLPLFKPYHNFRHVSMLGLQSSYHLLSFCRGAVLAHFEFAFEPRDFEGKANLLHITCSIARAPQP